MKLYDWKVAPNPRRVRMFVAEKGIELDIVDVGEPGSASLTSDYLAGSTHRLVPELELDDGTLIAEAPVICRYLETIYPEPVLLGRDAKEQAFVSIWDRKCEIEGLHAVAEVLRNKAKSFAGRALPGYTVPIEQIAALVERGALRTNAFYQKLNTRLGESAYLAMDTLTFADITGFCVVEMAKAGKMAIPDDCPNVRRWYDAIAARESAQA